jgi:hypothetical protein
MVSSTVPAGSVIEAITSSDRSIPSLHPIHPSGNDALKVSADTPPTSSIDSSRQQNMGVTFFIVIPHLLLISLLNEPILLVWNPPICDLKFRFIGMMKQASVRFLQPMIYSMQ